MGGSTARMPYPEMKRVMQVGAEGASPFVVMDVIVSVLCTPLCTYMDLSFAPLVYDIVWSLMACAWWCTQCHMAVMSCTPRLSLVSVHDIVWTCD